jgi:hypothetical protein
MAHTFEGNQGETKTLVPAIRAFTAAHQLPDVTIVADAGMISEANQKDIEKAGLSFMDRPQYSPGRTGPRILAQPSRSSWRGRRLPGRRRRRRRFRLRLAPAGSRRWPGRSRGGPAWTASSTSPASALARQGRQLSRGMKGSPVTVFLLRRGCFEYMPLISSQRTHNNANQVVVEIETQF